MQEKIVNYILYFVNALVALLLVVRYVIIEKLELVNSYDGVLYAVVLLGTGFAIAFAYWLYRFICNRIGKAIYKKYNEQYIEGYVLKENEKAFILFMACFCIIMISYGLICNEGLGATEYAAIYKRVIYSLITIFFGKIAWLDTSVKGFIKNIKDIMVQENKCIYVVVGVGISIIALASFTSYRITLTVISVFLGIGCIGVFAYIIYGAKKTKKMKAMKAIEAASKEEKNSESNVQEEKYVKVASTMKQNQNTEGNEKLIKVVQGGIVGGAFIFEVVKTIRKRKRLSKKNQ